MRHYRPLALASLLAIAAATQANAQMTPDNTWAMLQDYMTGSGSELSVGETRRDNDRLVLSKVTLTTEHPGESGTTVVEIPEIVLRDIGSGKVEITSAPESLVKSTTSDEGGDPITNELKIRTVDNITIASGSPEKPVFDFTAKSFEMLQDSSSAELPPISVAITGGAMSGQAKLDMSASPKKVDYVFDMATLDLVSKGKVDATDDASGEFDVHFTMKNMKGAYAGLLPDSNLTSAEVLPALEGKLDYSTGPTSLRMKSTGAMPMAATFLSSSSLLKLDFAPAGGTFTYELAGIDIVAADDAPAKASSTSTLSAKGQMTVPASAAGEVNLEGAHGKVTLQLTSVSPLLDRIVAAKLASAEDMAGVRMMMGFFTRPGAEADSIVVDLEQTAEGKTLVNGEEMP